MLPVYMSKTIVISIQPVYTLRVSATKIFTRLLGEIRSISLLIFSELEKHAYALFMILSFFTQPKGKLLTLNTKHMHDYQ